MILYRFCLLAGSAIILSGCASAVTAWKNDPLQSYDITTPTVYAMTGDRRTAVMMSTAPTMRFCAESLPDAVAAFSAASKANAAIPDKASAGFEDATYSGLLQTFQRTEIAEVYRQIGWNICLAWAQGAIDPPEYKRLLGMYVVGGLDAVSNRSRQEQKWPTIAPGSLFVGPGAAAAAQPKTDDKKDEDKDKDKKKDDKPAEEAPATATAVDLGDGVQLVSAQTASGYCIKAAAGYTGTGAITKPKPNPALPLCT